MLHLHYSDQVRKLYDSIILSKIMVWVFSFFEFEKSIFTPNRVNCLILKLS